MVVVIKTRSRKGKDADSKTHCVAKDDDGKRRIVRAGDDTKATCHSCFPYSLHHPVSIRTVRVSYSIKIITNYFISFFFHGHFTQMTLARSKLS